jgi:ABC-2 type transport system permease protein
MKAVMNWNVVSGLVLRYTYLYRRSLPRILEMIFWPSMDLLVWGFVTRYLTKMNPTAGGAVTFLIGAMIFWDVLYRSAQGVTVSFLEDLWSKNIMNVFVAPVRLREFVAATFLVGIGKTGFIVLLLAGLSVVLYGFNLDSLGLSLIPFFANLLIMGWTIGIFTMAIIMRYGQSMEAMAWGVPFLIQPFSAVFYPVNVLPVWMQTVAWCLPSTPVFEGMRAVLREGSCPLHLFWYATALNAFWFILASLFLGNMHRVAREKGYLAKLGTQ